MNIELSEADIKATLRMKEALEKHSNKEIDEKALFDFVLRAKIRALEMEELDEQS